KILERPRQSRAGLFRKIILARAKGFLCRRAAREKESTGGRSHGQRRAAEQLSLCREPRTGRRNASETLRRSRAAIPGRSPRLAIARAVAGVSAAAGNRQ